MCLKKDLLPIEKRKTGLINEQRNIIDDIDIITEKIQIIQKDNNEI